MGKTLRAVATSDCLPPMDPTLDPIIGKLLALHTAWDTAGKPFTLCLDLWFDGFTVSGEVCTSKDYFNQQPEPLPYMFATLWHSTTESNDGTSGFDELMDTRWLYLRNASSGSGYVRLDLTTLRGWSVREVRGFIPRNKW